MPPAPRTVLTRTVPSAYLPLIEQMRFYIEPEISCSRFFSSACFTEESMNAYRQSSDAGVLRTTELGAFIAQHLRGGLFIDCPCGLHDARERKIDCAIPPVAAALGAVELWEVDLSADVLRDRLPQATDILSGGYSLTKESNNSSERRENDMIIHTMQDDLLGFIAKIEPQNITQPLALYISALQPDADLCADIERQRTIAVPYLEALYNELARVTASGNLVILNASTMLCAGITEELFPHIHPALALPPRGFTLMRRCALDKVHVFRKD